MTERIRADLDEAESAKAEVTSKAAEYEAKLADARHEAGRIIEEARQDADAYRTDKRAEADAEVAASASRPRPTSRRPRPRPSPTSAARWPRWPSVPPSRSSVRA